MKKLILKCGLSPGDIVMLTAAVRDLHYWYPGKFLTDVRTSCADLWDNNPYRTALQEEDQEVEVIDCKYPLINRANESPYHCLHGFIEFLNERLGLAIKPTQFKGDIHLSPQEKAWYSQVHEVTREATPFWIVAAGGKFDVTIKWWQTERYQQVVDHFRDRLLFVQVGNRGHHHPRLDGVVDLRGQTTLRELVRLVYHAEGVLCSVTALMHLAAAVEVKRGLKGPRPCVVVAGGREPAHWEAYPGHQFIHTNGALPCCTEGGCWKDRVAPLRDGDRRDQPSSLCVDVVGTIPRCMQLITPAEVTRRIEGYFSGGIKKYLSARQRAAARRGMRATEANGFDDQTLNLHNAGMACDAFVKTIDAYPNRFEGRGIVICGGGARYFTNAWVCLHMLRRLGCTLPVQLWHLGRKECDARMAKLLRPLGAECVDALNVRKKFPTRILGGWQLKPYAILHSRFREVLLLDADNVPVVDPEFLFETSEYKETGAIFWPDYCNGSNAKLRAIWRSCGMRTPREAEFESGQIVVDKERCWAALRLSSWFNENSDFYYQYIYGDKETFHLAFKKVKKSYSLVKTPIHPLEGVMCQHDFDGRRIFQHRNRDKWDLFLHNRRVKGFWYEAECRRYVRSLRKVWDGTIKHVTKRSPHRSVARSVRMSAVLITSRDREELRLATIYNLARTDWQEKPVVVELEAKAEPLRIPLWALSEGLKSRPDYVLLLRDGLEFNRHLRHNLENWAPLKRRVVGIASLCNPGVHEWVCHLEDNARLVDPRAAFGGAAWLVSRSIAERLLKRSPPPKPGKQIAVREICCGSDKPVFYHAPSLVRSLGLDKAHPRSWRAVDFHAGWKT